MRRTLVALASAALATLAFAGVAFASPTRPDLELTVAQVQFEINGPNIAKTMINAKPGEAGYYRAQFTPQGNGDFTVTTIVDNEIVSPKPYHFQVSGAALPAWTQPAAGAIALLAALGLGALLFRRRAMGGRAVTATN